jgi:non-canonical poly(A) RNA polymerase PAPD5/7
VQEVYDKKVLHRLVGVSPRATVVQDDPQQNGAARSNGSIVQSAWEPTERSQERDDEGHTRKSGFSAKARSQEIIDVDADDDDEGRYGIPRKRRRRMNEVIDTKTVFTTDEESEGEDVIEVETSEEGGGEKGGHGHVKINRKRAFWAAKAGTSAGLGTERVA